MVKDQDQTLILSAITKEDVSYRDRRSSWCQRDCC